MSDHILFLDTEPADRPRVQARFPDASFADTSSDEDVLVRHCRDATIISTFITTRFSRQVIEQLPLLTLLCTRSVGFDHIDMNACHEQGITVCNVPDYGSHVIAEHVFALLLSTMRHISVADRRVESGTFDYRGLKGMALMGKTIGIVGTGHIGRSTARIAHGFQMRILAVDVCKTIELEQDYGVQYVDYDRLFAESDIISLHVPALPSTKHLINAQRISSMKRGVVLINTARGSLIDTAALLEGLNSGQVAYALLDVLEHETNVIHDRDLVDHPQVVLTPHIAFYTDTSVQKMYDECFQSIDQWLAGEEPTHLVHSPTIVCER